MKRPSEPEKNERDRNGKYFRIISRGILIRGEDNVDVFYLHGQDSAIGKTVVITGCNVTASATLLHRDVPEHEVAVSTLHTRARDG